MSTGKKKISKKLWFADALCKQPQAFLAKPQKPYWSYHSVQMALKKHNFRLGETIAVSLHLLKHKCHLSYRQLSVAHFLPKIYLILIKNYSSIGISRVKGFRRHKEFTLIVTPFPRVKLQFDMLIVLHYVTFLTFQIYIYT